MTRMLVPVLTSIILWAGTAMAQDATISGSIADESKAALPGVTVTATALTTGREFVDVTSERGEYRLVGLPSGQYKLEAQLTGFATTTLPQLELLVGQNAAITITLKLASVEENVTVRSDAPFVDVRQAQVAGNVDRRQMEDLPISGRNWLELSKMVKGVTANTIGNTPGTGRTAGFRINLDGQEVTQDRVVSSFGQPGINRDAIAEYQIVTNMFDVTMGRSVGIQVEAVTRSGTNRFGGSAYGFFRSDSFNAKDAFLQRVLPYSNQQVGGTVGGPIAKDKLHYFISSEYERQPGTYVLAPAVGFAGQTLTFPIITTIQSPLVRVDYQVTGRDHLVLRSNYYKYFTPQEFTGAGNRVASRERLSTTSTANWSRVVRSNLLQEVHVSYFGFETINLSQEPLTKEYIFPGLTIGSSWNQPSHEIQNTFTTRGGATWQKKSHDIKFGSEFNYIKASGWWRARERGQIFFNRLPDDISRRIPLDSGNDPSRWDLSGLDSTAIRFDINYTRDNWNYAVPRPQIATWFGDTWNVHPRLTLNLGLRYDASWGDFVGQNLTETDVVINNGLFTENVGYRNDIRDWSNLAPRAGFVWKLRDANDFIVRGGSGLFYSTQGANQVVDVSMWNGQHILANSYVNDGQPGFISDPTRGVTAADVIAGRVKLPPQAISVIAQNYRQPLTWQSMVGLQKQLGHVTGFDTDLVYYRGSHEDVQRDPNLFYDPVTGLPKNPNVFGRPRPDYGPISLKDSSGHSEYMGLATALSRRYQNNFQMGLTYTLMFFMNDTGIGNQGYGNQNLNPFNVNMDWGRSAEFQRHTVNANGLWKLPAGFSLSGSFHFGSGNYTTITSPVDPLATGTRRVRADLSVIPRNTFKLDPWQTLDIRIAKDFRLRGTFNATAIAEVFNTYNYARFNRNVVDGNALFGQAVSSASPPRTGQLAFRVAW